MQAYQIKNSWWQKMLYCLYHLPQNTYNYSKDKVEKYGAEYMPFAFFMAFNYMIPFFMKIQPGNNSIYIWLFVIKTIGVCLCIGLILRPYWANWFQKYFPIYWHFTLFYCIPFSFTLLFLINGSNIQSLVNVALATMLLILLVDRTTFLALSLGGSIIGIWFYTQFIDKIPILELYDLYIIFHVCIFSIIIGLIFGRRVVYLESTSQRNDQLCKFQQEALWEIATVMQYQKKLQKELTADKAAPTNPILDLYMQQAIYRMVDHVHLNITSINLGELLGEIIRYYHGKGTAQAQLLLNKSAKRDIFQADYSKIKQLFFNAINYVNKVHTTNSNFIDIMIEDAQLEYRIANIETCNSKLPALKMTITKEFVRFPKSQHFPCIIDLNLHSEVLNKQEIDPLLLENIHIVNAHYGCVAENSSQTLVYIFPISLLEMQEITTRFFSEYTDSKS